MKRTREEGEEGSANAPTAFDARALLFLEDTPELFAVVMGAMDPTSRYALSFASKELRHRVGKPTVPLASLLRSVFQEGYAVLFIDLFHKKLIRTVDTEGVALRASFASDAECLRFLPLFITNLIANVSITAIDTDMCLSDMSCLFSESLMTNPEFQLLFLSRAMSKDHREHYSMALCFGFTHWMKVYYPPYDPRRYREVIVRLCQLPPDTISSATLAWFILSIVSHDDMFNGDYLLRLLENMAVVAQNLKLLKSFWVDFALQWDHIKMTTPRLSSSVSPNALVPLCAKSWESHDTPAGRYFWKKVVPKLCGTGIRRTEFQRQILNHSYEMANPWENPFLKHMWQLSQSVPL